MPKLADPTDALWFLLLTEWHDSGREFWPFVCDAINEPNNAVNSEAALFAQAEPRHGDFERAGRSQFHILRNC
jgi:hypothetical protein